MAERGMGEEHEIDNLDENEDPIDDKEEETDFGGGHDDSSRFRHFNTTFEDGDIKTPLLQPLPEEIKNDEAEVFIKKVYENTNFNKILYGKNEYDFVWVSLKATNSKKFFVTEDGIQGTPGKKLLDFLGKKIEEKLEVIDTTFNDLQMQNEELKLKLEEKTDKIKRQNNDLKNSLDHIKNLERQNKTKEDSITDYNKENKKLQKDLDESSSPQERKELEKEIKEKTNKIINLQKELEEYKQIKENINKEIRELKEHIENSTDQEEKQRLEEQIEQLENRMEIELTRHEELFERMSLRNKVKYIFKKHGFTLFSISIAVGTVIGVIVSNLSSGLASVTKGVGNGLKALGKKIAQILPGMIGAIASFIFKTAGSVLGFLAKNSWLLILFIVTYAVEQYASRGSDRKK